MVAAGGSGACGFLAGAPGGDLTGYTVYGRSTRTKQTLENANGIGSSGSTSKYYPSSGAPGGYKGGVAETPNKYNPDADVSDSGSSYISGYEGCEANEQMILDSGKMVVGAKEGDGYIQIDQIYECPPNCTVCLRPQQCTNCEILFHLHDGLCIPTCPEKTIDRYTYCEKCDSICADCLNEATNCTDCYDGFYFYRNQCLKECPVGTYKHEGMCYEICPVGTYSIGQSCEECDLSCQECIDIKTKCTACPEGKYLFNNECLENCPERTVRDGNIFVQRYLLYQVS